MAKISASPSRKTVRKNLAAAPVPPLAAPSAEPRFFQAGIFFSLFCFGGAVLNFATQAVFRRDLLAGEFGTLNAVLGLVGLLGVPLSALNQTVTHHLAQHHARGEGRGIALLRAAARRLLELAATGSAVLAFLLLFSLVWLFHVPRLSLHLYALMLVWIALGGTLSSAFSLGLSRFRFWGLVILTAALARFLLALRLTPLAPWAETALALSALAGLITLVPLLFAQAELEIPRWTAVKIFLERSFLLYFFAALSVALGLYFFAFSDQLIAQKWFGPQPNAALPEAAIAPTTYDAYQAAGLLGRALLWGTQPLLLVYFTQRSTQGSGERSGPRAGFRFTSLLVWAREYRLLFLYLAALAGGAVFLDLFRVPLVRLFTGREDMETAGFIGRFALAMVPIGLLQALGTGFLAARRFAECFMLGLIGCSYFILLYLAGRQPDLLLAYMFGGSMLALFYFLFYVIIKWSRTQP